MKKKCLILLLLIAYCVPLQGYSIVIAGEAACSNQDYLEHARQPHRVMNTLSQAWWQIFKELEQYGITTTLIGRHKIADYPSADLYIFLDMPFFSHAPLIADIAHKSFVVLSEPATIIYNQYDADMLRHFNRVFTWDDAFAANHHFIKYCLPVLKPYVGSDIPFTQKKFACMICGNKGSWVGCELYSQRKKIIDFFHDHHANLFNLFGPDWPDSPIYKGILHDKLPCLQDHRFNFCLENTCNTTGYITEKLFDAMHAGNIPIYAGASNIDDYVPRSCYIAYDDFQSLEDLLFHIRHITQDDYNEYQRNIRAYLASEQAQQFSIDRFVDLFVGEILQFFDLK